MALCIGGKACRRQACKNRCKSWFSAQPDIERQCKNACKDNISFSREDFLCSGKWVDRTVVMLTYGYDPCPGQAGGRTMEELLDPLGDRERDEQKREDLQPVILGGALLILAALVVLVMVLRS